MQGIRYCLTPLFKRFAETPELAKFRRFLEVWSWILYDEITNIEKLIKECNDAIAKANKAPHDGHVFRITDEPRASIEEQYEDLKPKLDGLVKSVRRYGKDLLLAHRIANMPLQHDVFARNLAQTPDLFFGGVYGPTKEQASVYSQVPSHPDTCSLKDFNVQVFAPDSVLESLQPINEWLHRSINYILRKKVDPKSTPQHFVEHKTVQTVMLLLAALYAPLLLAGSLGVLSCLKSEGLRIVVLGVFAFLLGISLVPLVPNIKPSDLFVIIAAHFAVGGVYIGAKGIDYHSVGA